MNVRKERNEKKEQNERKITATIYNNKLYKKLRSEIKANKNVLYLFQ